MTQPNVAKFTRTQLQQLWDEGLTPDHAPLFDFSDPRCQSHRVHCTYLYSQADTHSASREKQIRIPVAGLMEAAGSSQDRFSKLDALFSAGLLIRADDALANRSIPVVSPVNRAAQLLERLPSTPPRLSPSDAVCQNPFNSQIHPSTVVKRFDTVSLKLALVLVSCPWAALNVASCIRRFLDFMIELLDTLAVTAATDQAGSLDDALRIDIVISYIWASWTRCSLLLFWYIFGTQLTLGYDDEWEQLMALRSTHMLMDPEIRTTLYGPRKERSQYMCSWAFELLKSDRAAPFLDFRHFHKRYAELHSRHKQRCLSESENPCNGADPLSCGRFEDKRLVAADQSVHGRHRVTPWTRLCGRKENRGTPCTRLCWSRETYVSVGGAVAVSTRIKTKTIPYTKASALTMAISHVWSHGHGGRPDTGLNMCLHERFSRIAERHQCDSYWIDTACIPDDHLLREEAIGHINWIFAESKVVLVLDRDIMDIDISKMQPTIPVLESVLATLLVCDWNVRAWTLLEALKGSHNLQLLCQNDTTLSLRDTLSILHREGRLDLTALILATRHLMPSSKDASRRKSSRKSVESAGNLLSHRHATRPGDDIVIWSLISHPEVSFNAGAMWRNLVGRDLRTAFLMSTSPRLMKVPGFSWAPETPYIRQAPSGTTMSPGRFLVHEGSGSEVARITKKGLLGDWWFYRYEPSHDDLFRDVPVDYEGELKQSIFEGPRNLNPCWKTAMELSRHYIEVALIQPIFLDIKSAGHFSGGRGETQGPLFATCFSPGGSKWHWAGVDSWPNMKGPAMVKETLLIV